MPLLKTRFIPVLTLLLGLVIPFLSSAHAWAVSNTLKAKSEIMRGQELFKNQAYDEAILKLSNARQLLGKSTSDIQYYLAASHYEMKQYLKAQKELETFFEITSESSFEQERYQKMVRLISLIEDGLKGKNPPSVFSVEKVSSGNTAAAAKIASAVEKRGKSLDEVARTGVPVEAKLFFKKGRTEVKRVTEKGFCQASKSAYDIGIEKREVVNKDVQIEVEHLSMNEDKSSFAFRSVKTDYANQKSSGSHEGTLPIKLVTMKSFPVPFLKTGVSWTENVKSLYLRTAIPVTYQVIGFENLNGFDCVRIKGQGNIRPTEYRLGKETLSDAVASLEHEYCYDYNNGGQIYEKIWHFGIQRGLTKVDVTRETKRISLKYK